MIYKADWVPSVLKVQYERILCWRDSGRPLTNTSFTTMRFKHNVILVRCSVNSRFIPLLSYWSVRWVALCMRPSRWWHHLLGKSGVNISPPYSRRLQHHPFEAYAISIKVRCVCSFLQLRGVSWKLAEVIRLLHLWISFKTLANFKAQYKMMI